MKCFESYEGKEISLQVKTVKLEVNSSIQWWFVHVAEFPAWSGSRLLPRVHAEAEYPFFRVEILFANDEEVAFHELSNPFFL